MMFELHEAFSRYHEDVSQSIHLINSSNADKKFISSYGVEFESNTSAQIVKKAIRHKGDSVLLYHKLMASKTDFLRPVYTRSPVIVLNHTHSESVQYNRIRNADKIIAVCENMKHNLNKMRVPIQIDVIHNGVNGDRYEEILPMERSIDNVLLTGRVNALNRIKYSESWLDWCLQVDLPKKMIHEYMGGGEYLKSARRHVGSVSGPKNDVHILGSISEFDKKVSRLKSWDIFLYDINRNEGLSMAVLEALASGVPVVCSNHFGNKEVIKDGVNGFVYRNKAELENILTELCLQPELIEEMKTTTLGDFNKNLDAKITSSKYRKVIEKVISNKGNIPISPRDTVDREVKKRSKVVSPPNNIKKSKVRIKRKRNR